MYFNLITSLLLTYASLSTGAQELNNHQPETPTYVQSGLIKLIIEAYTDDILRELASSSKAKLSSEQLSLLRQKLKQIYQHVIQHPSLKETRLWVGENSPTSEPSLYQTNYVSQTSNYRTHNKRYLRKTNSRTNSGVRLMRRSMLSNHVFSQEVCKTELGWERFNVSYDEDHNKVQVVQDVAQQYVFTYRCNTPNQPCKGINSLYQSECAERQGWVYLYYRKIEPANSEPEWGYVSVPHHCACKISPKPLI